MTTTDDPHMLSAQRQAKHANRVEYVYDAEQSATPTQQWERAVELCLALSWAARDRRIANERKAGK